MTMTDENPVELTEDEAIDVCLDDSAIRREFDQMVRDYVAGGPLPPTAA